ncbi:MAG: polyketide synthase dehydratase domain-containing protein, partial [Cyanobacteria bacterium P01_H01_bin.121]
VNLAALQNTLEPIAAQQLTELYARISLTYGPMLQAVQQAWVGAGQALLAIATPPALQAQVGNEPIHPVLLDACTRLTADALDLAAEPGIFWAPWQIESISLIRSAPPQFYAYVAQPSDIDQQSQTRIYDIQLLDQTGQVFGTIERFTLKRAPQQAFLRRVQPHDDNGLAQTQWEPCEIPIVSQQAFLKNLEARYAAWFYQVQWQPSELKPSKIPAQSGVWLLFVPTETWAEVWQTALAQQEQHCICVLPGPNFQVLDEQCYQVGSAQKASFQQLFQHLAANSIQVRGVLQLWSLADSGLAIAETQQLICGSTLSLVQTLTTAMGAKAPPLWLVTQGAQCLDDQKTVSVEQSTLWGLGRAIALEYPKLQCRRIDLDLAAEQSQSTLANTLIQELAASDAEDQIAYRNGQRYLARLQRYQPETPQDQPQQLKLNAYGSLERLVLQPQQRRSPQAGEVEIAVRAVGLNFRDVLTALGLMQQYTQDLTTNVDEVVFGGECAGVISAVGPGVEHLQVGDEVVSVLALGCLAHYVTMRADLVMPKPQHLSFEEAATLPVAFLTAHYGLQHLAKLKAGDRILIHSAAGGVGQAAVQLAQRQGAEIFATASQPKWETLQQQGINHIMNSRSLEFTEQIKAVT